MPLDGRALTDELETRTTNNEIQQVLQFGYVSMFAVVFPLAPLFAYLNNLWEFKLDLSQLVKTRRPQVRAGEAEGPEVKPRFVDGWPGRKKKNGSRGYDVRRAQSEPSNVCAQVGPPLRFYKARALERLCLLLWTRPSTFDLSFATDARRVFHRGLAALPGDDRSGGVPHQPPPGGARLRERGLVRPQVHDGTAGQLRGQGV